MNKIVIEIKLREIMKELGYDKSEADTEYFCRALYFSADKALDMANTSHESGLFIDTVPVLSDLLIKERSSQIRYSTNGNQS
jgi:hypothetical protein